MRKKIINKLDSEYEFFFLESMRNSKANLFAKSYEIETKKQVQSFLREFVENGEELDELAFAKQIYLTDNIMDECYRYINDHQEKNLEEACREYILKRGRKKE